MPSQQEVKWSQLKVGLVVLGSLVLLCILLFAMTSASGVSPFSRKITVDAYFADSKGLKKGGEVDLQGVPVGEVKDVVISQDPARKLTPVHAVLKLNPKYSDQLKVDSTAELDKAGLVGDTMININSQRAVGRPLRDGDVIPTTDSSDLDAVMQESKNTLQTLNSTLGKVNTLVEGISEGQGTVGQLIKNRELFDNLNQTTRGLNQLVTAINTGHGSVGKLLHDDELYNHLNDTATKLDTVATNLQSGKGSAGKLLTDDALYNNLNASLSHLNSILSDADQGKGALGLMTRNPEFAHKLDDTVTNLDQLLAGINKGEGTLGKLAHDSSAYDNLNALLKNSDELVTMFRKDPKKYLTIHMRIF